MPLRICGREGVNAAIGKQLACKFHTIAENHFSHIFMRVVRAGQFVLQISFDSHPGIVNRPSQRVDDHFSASILLGRPSVVRYRSREWIR